MKDLQITKNIIIDPHANGDIWVCTKDEDGIYVGYVNDEGEFYEDDELSSSLKEIGLTKDQNFEENIVKALKDLFDDRGNCSWPDINDWPEQILMFMGVKKSDVILGDLYKKKHYTRGGIMGNSIMTEIAGKKITLKPGEICEYKGHQRQWFAVYYNNVEIGNLSSYIYCSDVIVGDLHDKIFRLITDRDYSYAPSCIFN